MNKKLLLFSIIIIHCGPLIAVDREGSKITFVTEEGSIKVISSTISVEIVSSDPNNSKVTIKLDGKPEYIEEKLAELEEKLDYMRANHSELSKSSKYKEYMERFEEELNSLCDRSKSYISRLDDKAEQLVKKLEEKCRHRDDQLEWLGEDIKDMEQQQKKKRKELKTMSVTSPEYFSRKTEYYRERWKLRSIKVKAAALKLQNASNQLIISAFYNTKALQELKAEFFRHKFDLENPRASPPED